MYVFTWFGKGGASVRTILVNISIPYIAEIMDVAIADLDDDTRLHVMQGIFKGIMANITVEVPVESLHDLDAEHMALEQWRGLA